MRQPHYQLEGIMLHYYVHAFINTKQDPTLPSLYWTVHTYVHSRISRQSTVNGISLFSPCTGSQQRYIHRQMTIDATVPLSQTNLFTSNNYTLKNDRST